MAQVSNDFKAVLPDGEEVPGESYRRNDRIHAYVVSVECTGRGPRTTLSRTHLNLVVGLFQRKVPETQQGLVKIKAIAHKTSHRMKVVVVTTHEGINTRGACIDPMGACVHPVVAELGREKIDIVDYPDDPMRFVANLLSPARVTHVVVHSVDSRTATAIVPGLQLSSAIGKKSQDVCLVARLTNYHVNIHADTKTSDDAIALHVSTPDDVVNRS